MSRQNSEMYTRPVRWVLAGQPQIEVCYTPTYGTMLRVAVNTFGKTNMPSKDAELVVQRILQSVSLELRVDTKLIRCNTEQKPGKYFSKIITTVYVGPGFMLPSEAQVRAAKAIYRRILLVL